MNFMFGLIIGVGLTLFATNPEWLGGALHWAGDAVENHEMTMPEINRVEDKE